jgi:hypothetical protein
MTVIVDIDHDDGTLDEYTSTVTEGGQLSVEVGAALAGTVEGLQCIIDDTNQMYGGFYLGAGGNTSGIWRHRFYLDTNEFSLGDGQIVRLYLVTDTGDSLTVCWVYLTWNTGTGFAIFAGGYDDQTDFDTADYDITEGEHYIELLMVQPTDEDSDDGVMTLWIDGAHKETIDTLDNYLHTANIRYIRFGPSYVQSGTGTLFLDELIVNDDGGEIGPVVVGGIAVDIPNITIATPETNASSPQQFSHECSTDVKLLVVTVTIYDTSSSDGVVSGVTYNGDPLDDAALYYDSLCDGHVSIWWMALPDTGSSYTVEVTFGGQVTDFEAAAVGVEGALGSFALDASGGENTGTTGDLFVTWDAVAEDSISFAAALDDQTDAGKVTPAETEIYTVDVGDVVSAEYAIRSASGSQTMTIADADGDEDWVIVGAGFYEIALAGEYYQDADGVLTPAGDIIKSSGKILAGITTLTGSISKATSKTFTGSSTLVGVLVKQAQKIFTGTSTFAGSLAASKRILISLTGSLTPSGSLIKQAGKVFTGSITAAGSLIRSTAKALTGSATLSGLLSTTKVTLLAIGGAITASGTLIKQTVKSFVGSVTAVGSLLRATRKLFIGSLTPAGTLIRQTLKAFVGAITAAGSLATQKISGGYFQVVGGGLTMSGIVVRRTNKLFTGSMTAAGSLIKQTAKSIVGSVTAIGSLATQKIAGGYFQVAGGVLTMSGIVTRQTNKIFTGSVTTVGTLVKQAVKAFAGSITSVGSLATLKSSFKIIGGVLTLAGDLVRQTSKQTAGVITMAGSITKRISKSFTGAITAIGTLARQILGLPVPAVRIYVIESESRVYAIEAETRIYAIASENRIYPIPG